LIVDIRLSVTRKIFAKAEARVNVIATTCSHLQKKEENYVTSIKRKCVGSLQGNAQVILTCALLVNVDVLRLVTRSSPQGEERVTSIRTSAWEAII